MPGEGKTPQFDERTLPEGQRGAVLQKLYIPLCAVLGGEILVSSRLGPRMESAVNMNSQAHDNMSASHWRCGDVNGMGTCTFSLACKERINALNISD